MPCVERYEDGENVAERPCLGADAPPPSHGCLAGTALKAILASVGIVATPDCSCNKRAAEMDRNGCDWCETNIDLIVGWLREEAEKRKLPFVDFAGRLLVKRAISNARRAKLPAAPHPPEDPPDAR